MKQLAPFQNPQQNELNSSYPRSPNPSQTALGVSTLQIPPSRHVSGADGHSLESRSTPTRTMPRRSSSEASPRRQPSPTPFTGAAPSTSRLISLQGDAPWSGAWRAAYQVSRSGRSQNTSRAGASRHPLQKEERGSQDGRVDGQKPGRRPVQRPKRKAKWLRIRIPRGKNGSKGPFPLGPTMFMEVTRHCYPYQPHSFPPDSIGSRSGTRSETPRRQRFSARCTVDSNPIKSLIALETTRTGDMSQWTHACQNAESDPGPVRPCFGTFRPRGMACHPLSAAEISCSPWKI
jgi:hypothetical protein